MHLLAAKCSRTCSDVAELAVGLCGMPGAGEWVVEKWGGGMGAHVLQRWR